MKTRQEAIQKMFAGVVSSIAAMCGRTRSNAMA